MSEADGGHQPERPEERPQEVFHRLNAYVQAALERGRPQHPCACTDCLCRLHAYDEGGLCIWCANNKHDDLSVTNTTLDGMRFDLLTVDFIERSWADENPNVGITEDQIGAYTFGIRLHCASQDEREKMRSRLFQSDWMMAGSFKMELDLKKTAPADKYGIVLDARTSSMRYATPECPYPVIVATASKHYRDYLALGLMHSRIRQEKA